MNNFFYAMDKNTIALKQVETDSSAEHEVGPEKEIRTMLARLQADRKRSDTKIIAESKPNQQKIVKRSSDNSKSAKL